MGAEAKTTLRLGRQTFAGTAQLETGELRFRGEKKLEIPLASVREVDVTNGALQGTHADGVAVLGLGDAASAKWAERQCAGWDANGALASGASRGVEHAREHGERIARDGAIWEVHPRGDRAVADTVIFTAGKEAGLTPTKVVRFSETDSAEKLVIPRAAR